MSQSADSENLQNTPSSEEGIPIFTVGDIAIDWLAANWQENTGPNDQREKAESNNPPWRNQPQVQRVAMMSGAWLLQNFLLRLAQSSYRHTYYCYKTPKPGYEVDTGEGYRRTANPDEYLHTFTELDQYDRGICHIDCPMKKKESTKREESTKKEESTKVYRIKTPSRYYGPKDDDPINRPGRSELIPYPELENGGGYWSDAAQPDEKNPEEQRNEDLQKLRLLVIFDGGDGFRSERQRTERWDDLIPEGPDENLYIVLFQKPPFPGDRPRYYCGEPVLWERIIKHHANRTVLVVSSDSLRLSGVNISKSLSWERTAQDFVAELGRTEILKELAKCKHLVVRFGLAGAIHYSSRGADVSLSQSTLYYDPQNVEGEYRNKDEGGISGLTAMLTATVVRSVADGLAKQGQQIVLREWVARGTHGGLLNCRTLSCHGFGKTPQDVYKLEEEDRWNDEFPSPRESDDLHVRESANGEAGSNQASDVKRSPIEKHTIPYNSFRWSILHDPLHTELEKIAYHIVRSGIEDTLSNSGVPRFPTARFGNYWVVDRDEIESFRSIRNLLQDHRDKNPTVPLSIAVFGPPGSGKSYGVEEIANSIGGEKEVEFETYNLAQFVEPSELSQALLPIRDVVLDGKLPIVFFDEFDAKLGDIKLGWLKYFLPMMQDGQFKHGERMLKIGGAVFVFAGGTSPTYQHFLRTDAYADEKRDFSDRKGPDFISRLRGYVNIRGANRENGEDEVFIIRRAIFLRSILQRKFKSSLFRGESAEIDLDVLHALLRIPEYTHGSRSMEAVLDMSSLVKATQFSASRLPSIDQLNMHVDGRRFMELLKEFKPDAENSSDGI